MEHRTGNSHQAAGTSESDLCTLRVLDDLPCDGITNMARDEALLLACHGASLVPTLRLYAWQTPTVSLGYFQRFTDYAALPPPACDLPVVRRLTGGGAILHDHELTYSLALPGTHPAIVHNPNRLYELVHSALISCLADAHVPADWSGDTDDSGPAKGPFFCFARRHGLDVLIGNDKIAGSAQRRTRHGILQHGSIIVERRFDQQPSASLQSFGIDLNDLRTTFVHAVADALGVSQRGDEWTAEELTICEKLEPKYRSDEWTRRR